VCIYLWCHDGQLLRQRQEEEAARRDMLAHEHALAERMLEARVKTETAEVRRS
jgi:hypothetical protein